MEKLFEADILRSFLPPPPVICQSLRAGSTCCALRPCQPSASCPRYFSVFVSIFQYSSVFSSSFQCFSVFFSNFSIFQYFSVFFSIQRLYHHHCWSIFVNHQIVKGDIWASFWNSLGLWEGSKLWTLYIFTSSFLFTKKWLSSFFGGSPMVQWGSWPSVTSLPLLCSFILHAFSITYIL